MITSRQNPKVQRVRELLGRSRERQAAGAFVVEGVRLVEEAEASGARPQLVLYTENLSPRGQAVIRRFDAAKAELEEVSDGVMDSLSDTETSQGILAVFPLPANQLPDRADFLILADSIRDPGNLGTLLRTAAAAGAQAVIAGPGTADPFSPKVVRAAMGAHFHLPVVAASWDVLSAYLDASLRAALRVWITDAVEGEICWEADLASPLILVIGSEAEGVSDQARALASGSLRIPMPGGSESLNAASAGAILMFEVVRQRRLSGQLHIR